MPPTATPPKTPRYDRIDALRGIAVVWMTVFHFCYDLNYFGWLRQGFLRDPFWTGQRTAIVSLFLFCAGLGQAIAVQQGQGWPRFWRRWAQVAGCAVLVSIGSWLVFKDRFIYFGVLHGIALMLVIARFTAHWRRWLWLAGALAMAAAWAAPALHQAWPQLDVLNTRAFNWLGLVSRKPFTEDYVPFFPWLGAMWWGPRRRRLAAACAAAMGAAAHPACHGAAGLARPLEPQLVHAAPARALRSAVPAPIDGDAPSANSTTAWRQVRPCARLTHPIPDFRFRVGPARRPP